MYQEEVKSAIILLYLGILAGMDVRKRQISLVLTGVLFLAGIGWQILVEQTSWLEWLLSLLPGAGFLTLSYISREQVGYGDGLLLLTVGIWLGFGQTFGVLTLGLILCSVLCGVLLMRKKIRKQDSIPLVPFLLSGIGDAADAERWFQSDRIHPNAQAQPQMLDRKSTRLNSSH